MTILVDAQADKIVRKLITIPPSQIFYTPNDIVPVEQQHKLINWRDIFTKGYFEIGDMANKDVVRAAKVGFKVTQQQVFDAVGSFCGRAGRTIRYYAEAAAFYPYPVRAEFDMLDFSLFVMARQFGDDWQKFLKFAQLYPGLGAEKVRRKYQCKEWTFSDESSSPASSGASCSGDISPSLLEEPGGVIWQLWDGTPLIVPPIPPGNTCETSHDLPARLPQDIMQSLSAFSDIIATAEHCLSRAQGLPPEVLHETTEAIATIRKHMPKIVSCIGGDTMIK